MGTGTRYGTGQMSRREEQPRVVLGGHGPLGGASFQLAASRLISTLGAVPLQKFHPVGRHIRATERNQKAAFLSFLLLTLAVTITFVPTTQAASIIRLALEHDRLTAGDLARVIPEWKAAAPHEPLGFAPLPGIDRRLARGQLLGWGKRLGLDLRPESMPDFVLVSRRMRQFTEAEAKTALTAAIAERHGLDADQVRIQLHDFEATPVPTGTLRLDSNLLLTQLNEPRSVPLRWKDGGGRSATIWLRATVSIMGRYAAAAESLEVGTTLRPEDFVFQTGQLAGDPKKYITTPEQVAGMTLKRPLREGEPLLRGAIARHHTVRRGDLVELQLKSRSIQLRVPGRAEQSGSRGETIACRNLESGQRISAVIVDSKHAEVEWIP